MPLVNPTRKGNYSLYIVSDQVIKMKNSSASFQQEKPQKQKKHALKNYDFETMPELNDEQIKALKKVSKKRHTELKEAVQKHVGRPKKDPEKKENIVSIRFSRLFLDKLKRKAKEEGYSQWQTYAKHVLEEKVNSK